MKQNRFLTCFKLLFVVTLSEQPKGLEAILTSFILIEIKGYFHPFPLSFTITMLLISFCPIITCLFMCTSNQLISEC